MQKKRLVRFSSLPHQEPQAGPRSRAFSRLMTLFSSAEKRSLTVVSLIACLCVISILTLLLFHELYSPKPGKAPNRKDQDPTSAANPANPENKRSTEVSGTENEPSDVNNDSIQQGSDLSVSANASVSRQTVKENAIAFMGRLANADYFLDEPTIEAISQAVETHRHSPQLKILFGQRNDLRPFVLNARNEDLNPSYIIFFCAIRWEDDQTSQSPKKMMSSFSEAKTLAVTFGKDANSYLLAVAAAGELPAISASPALLDRMRRTIDDNRSQRNVWYLHKVGAISETSYQRVLKFIAFGIISQNPKRYGIDAEPLIF